MIPVTPVILCGGSGTRLWPLSRAGFPKQFLCLTGEESLFQQAVRRLMDLAADDIAVAQPLIVANEEHRFLAAEQLREAGVALGAALLEPVGRNTAPALTLAALAAASAAPPEKPGALGPDTASALPFETADASVLDPVLVVTPADQTVADSAAFTSAMQTAIRAAAESDRIVILGIIPDRPETGYGYIEVAPSQDASSPFVRAVRRFVEKPDAATAQRYLEEGGYFWNAGMFVLRASVWRAAIRACRPDIANATEAAWRGRSQEPAQAALPFVRPDKTAFAAIPAESIDYAVMEPLTSSNANPASSTPASARSAASPTHSIEVAMVPLAAGWSDLGAWDAVWQALPKDEHGNAYSGDVLTTGSRNTLVHASSRLVSLVGVQDLIVVETPDAVLVADRARAQEVKHIVAALTEQGRAEPLLHRKVHRPWGWYDSIDEGGRFKVKRIQVRPRASLSLQMHHHRAEHWVVVKGTAEITQGSRTFLLTENQSTYIPLGETHRLSNPGTIPLEIIEVQSGSYLGEDDIVRFEDRYGRSA